MASRQIIRLFFKFGATAFAYLAGGLWAGMATLFALTYVGAVVEENCV